MVLFCGNMLRMGRIGGFARRIARGRAANGGRMGSLGAPEGVDVDGSRVEAVVEHVLRHGGVLEHTHQHEVPGLRVHAHVDMMRTACTYYDAHRLRI